MPDWLPSRQSPKLQSFAGGISEDAPVKTREPLGRDLLLELARDLDLRFRTELSRDEFGGPRPKAVSDIVACDDEVVSFLILAAQDDVRMGMTGVEMIRGDSVEPSAEILFHLPHEIADERFHVRELGAVLRRHDEAKLVTVASAAFREGVGIGAVGLAGI